MRTIFTLALGLVATAASAQVGNVATLRGPHLVCERMSTAAELYARQGDRNWEEVAHKARQHGLCVIFPEGIQVLLVEQDHVFSCLQPVGKSICGWTVMVPQQARDFGLDIPTKRYTGRR